MEPFELLEDIHRVGEIVRECCVEVGTKALIGLMMKMNMWFSFLGKDTITYHIQMIYNPFPTQT